MAIFFPKQPATGVRICVGQTPQYLINRGRAPFAATTATPLSSRTKHPTRVAEPEANDGHGRTLNHAGAGAGRPTALRKFSRRQSDRKHDRKSIARKLPSGAQLWKLPCASPKPATPCRQDRTRPTLAASRSHSVGPPPDDHPSTVSRPFTNNRPSTCCTLESTQSGPQRRRPPLKGVYPQ